MVWLCARGTRLAIAMATTAAAGETANVNASSSAWCHAQLSRPDTAQLRAAASAAHPLREALERIERKAEPLPATYPHQQRLGLIDAVYQSK
jgi:hypothetical protein